MNMLLIMPFRKHKWIGFIAAPPPRLGQSRSKEYLSFAAECQEIADRWPDLIKQQYEGLARQWLILAEQADRHSNRA